MIPYGHQEHRKDHVNSRRLHPATQNLETSYDDGYASIQSKPSARRYSLSPSPERSSKQGRSGKAVRDRRPEDSSAAATSRDQGSKKTVVLERGKPVVMRVVLISLDASYLIPRGSKQIRRMENGRWEDFADLP